jgi:hypothetical protein
MTSRPCDVAILDIMGVRGNDLLEICSRKNVTTVMLTAYALTPEDVKKSYTGGASYYLPKEEMASITITRTSRDSWKRRTAGRRWWYRQNDHRP